MTHLVRELQSIVLPDAFQLDAAHLYSFQFESRNGRLVVLSYLSVCHVYDILWLLLVGCQLSM